MLLRVLTSLLFLPFFAQAAPSPAVLVPRGAADLFQMFTGEDGDCSSYSGVDTWAEDAKEMATSGNTSLTELLKSSVPYTQSTMIWSHTALNMWGTEYEVPDNKEVTFPQGTNPLPQVQSVYDDILNALDTKRFTLTCGDKQWEWVKTYGDVGLEPADEPIAEYLGLDSCQVKGLWYNTVTQRFKKESPQLLDADGNPRSESICKNSNAFAMAFPTLQTLLLCDKLWESNVEENLAASKEAAAQVSSGTAIKDIYPRSYPVFHELLHLINRAFKDIPYTNSKGELEPGYGWKGARGVLLEGGGKELINVDNYVNYAFAASLVPQDFADGEKA
ncbi:uncharacterized protein N7459_004483 [Penicillium hispanicum]|uniref:uncharacterized protein n=1 Tax=Penicillium hispanicum TaxID=1080232 RepID=UPI0025418555|nr:uncharacterized protein N7459_004483 [Penicillium hispanicum]KAJ5584683.1 hypothetical protein N7459_004483 [Penicillium hispanicum]